MALKVDVKEKEMEMEMEMEMETLKKTASKGNLCSMYMCCSGSSTSSINARSTGLVALKGRL